MGTPVSTSLLYKVTYTVIGSGNPQMALTVKIESAKLNLQVDKTYNIHVKAIRRDNQLVQSDWSDALRVDSKNLGEFWYMVFLKLYHRLPKLSMRVFLWYHIA